MTAQAHGILWRAPNIFTSIRIERAATTIETADIEKALAIAAGLARPDRRIALDSRTRLYAPAGDTPHLDVEHIEFDQETGRIKAEIKVVGDDPALRTVTIYGRVETLVELPVLARTVMPGETIQPADLTTSWLRADLTPAGAVTDPQALIGKTPRRPLRPGQAFRPLDVELPLVIKRNDLVLIVLERPGMYLTAEGKALEDGGKGSVIRVMNVQSNRSVDAVDEESGRVSIRLAGPQASRLLRPAMTISRTFSAAPWRCPRRWSPAWRWPAATPSPGSARVTEEPPMTKVSDPTKAPGYKPVEMPVPEANKVLPQFGSIWQPGARAFFKDQRAKRVGDVLTVAITINDSAIMNDQTQGTRGDSDKVAMNNLFGLEGPLSGVMNPGGNAGRHLERACQQRPEPDQPIGTDQSSRRGGSDPGPAERQSRDRGRARRCG